MSKRLQLIEVEEAKAIASQLLNERSSSPMITRERGETIARHVDQLAEEVGRLNAALREIDGQLLEVVANWEMGDLNADKVRSLLLRIHSSILAMRTSSGGR